MVADGVGVMTPPLRRVKEPGLIVPAVEVRFQVP
jgi:hypothetical protein